ncbi:ParA family protein [Caenispirillum salinarum]|uniref:ParA family protein n=1 Tax=Caenispirillum salinarum TaxID=859058 RepID=UPI00384BB089
MMRYELGKAAQASRPTAPSPTAQEHGAEAPHPLATDQQGPVVIAIANQKGGVGKTTTSLNLAHALSHRGRRVLVVDLDPQANATLAAGVDRVAVGRSGRTIYNVLLQDRPLADIIQVSANLSFAVAPSGANADAAELELAGRTAAELLLRARIEDMAPRFDVILLDCPPNLGKLTLNGVLAARYLLIPTEAAAWSMAGIPLLLGNVDQVRRLYRHDIRLLGIVPTKVRLRVRQDQESLEELRRDYGDATHIFPAIRHTTAYAVSEAAGSVTLADNPYAPGVEAYYAIADQVLVSIARDMTPAVTS